MASKKITVGGVRVSTTTLLIVGLLILFIPTYIMIFKGCSIDDSALITSGADSVKATLPDGSELLSPTDDEGALLGSLMEINEGAKTASLPDDMSGYATYKAVFNIYGSEAAYEYYLSEDPSQCYFKSNHDKTYRISSEQATALLNQPVCEQVYAAAAAPKLTVSGQEIQAQELIWSYRVCSGEYLDSAASFSETYVVNDLPDISMNLGCEFSRKPDAVLVTVVGTDGTEIYAGDLAGMAGVVLDKNVEVLLTLNASWDKTGGAACGGSATYKLKGILHAPAEFYLNTSSVSEGGFVVLTGSNVLDTTALSVRVEPQDSLSAPYTYQPRFVRDGDFVRALIPVSKDLQNGTCGYNVIVTVGGTTYTVPFTATELKMSGDYVAKTLDNSIIIPEGVTLVADPYADLYASIAEAVEQVSDLTKVNMGHSFADGSCEKEYGTRGRYGTVLTYRKADGVDLVSHDNLYKASSATFLKAMHDGTVVFVGQTAYTGGLVVIDHGLGLFTWYWNLDSSKIGAEIVPGAAISKGAKIGEVTTCGVRESGDEGKVLSAHTAMTVFGVPVNNWAFPNGVSFGDGDPARVIAQVGGSSDPVTSEPASSSAAEE